MNTISFHQRSMLIADSIMSNLLQVAKKAAQSKATVLLCGESGTGKELFARYIHEMSPRQEQSFVTINCAAIPEGLMEAELFGFEKGAFTGAWMQRIGKFEKAKEGTLLLDEVTEMPIALQAKLLRVIQEGEIDRLGGKDPIAINTRLIATSNRDPLQLAKEGCFREDLFYRLNVLRIDCPPLRERPEAIKNFAQYFLNQNCEKYQKDKSMLSPSLLELLQSYHWPGNIRELSNVIERAVLLSDQVEIQREAVIPLLNPAVSNGNRFEETGSLASIEQQHIEETLKNTNGNKTEAARRLGISVRTLRNKVRQYHAVG